MSSTINDFEIVKALGEGSFGSVYKVKRKKNGKEYALKKVKMNSLSSKEKESALNEVRILASINSSYIIKYKEAFYDEQSSCLYIVMELASNGDLSHKITALKKARKFMDEKQVWEYAGQMLKGLKSLHDMKILHRDLKGANVFLTADQKQIKIGDLNVSKVQKANFVQTQTGTPYYLCPEVWRGERYDNKCDIWSTGCVIYECCAQVPPFTGTSMDDLYKKVQRCVFKEIPNTYSQQMKNFCNLCLKKNPKDRPNCEQLLGMFKFEDEGREKSPISQNPGLLATIKLPNQRFMNELKHRLPKANYEEEVKIEVAQTEKVTKKTNDEPIKSSKPIPQTPQQKPDSSGSYRPRPSSQGGNGNYHQRQNSVGKKEEQKIQKDLPPTPSSGNRNNNQQQNIFSNQQQQKNLPPIPSNRQQIQRPDSAKNAYNEYQQQYNRGIYARSPSGGGQRANLPQVQQQQQQQDNRPPLRPLYRDNSADRWNVDRGRNDSASRQNQNSKQQQQNNPAGKALYRDASADRYQQRKNVYSNNIPLQQNNNSRNNSAQRNNSAGRRNYYESPSQQNNKAAYQPSPRKDSGAYGQSPRNRKFSQDPGTPSGKNQQYKRPFM